MKVKADFDLCESNGLCEGFAPDVFELDDNDYLIVKTDQVTEANQAQIRQAVAACPKAALRLVEE